MKNEQMWSDSGTDRQTNDEKDDMMIIGSR